MGCDIHLYVEKLHKGKWVMSHEVTGVGQSVVSNWRARGNVPPEHCAAIEMATGGLVSRKDFHPDDWARIWPELTARAAA